MSTQLLDFPPLLEAEKRSQSMVFGLSTPCKVLETPTLSNLLGGRGLHAEQDGGSSVRLRCAAELIFYSKPFPSSALCRNGLPGQLTLPGSLGCVRQQFSRSRFLG